MNTLISHHNHGINQSGLWVELNLNKSQTIKRITDGTGIVTDIEYGSLADPTLHRIDQDAVYPIRDIAPTTPVVRTYMTDDGTGGRVYFHYQYRGLKVDLHGRGFCGFREITLTDSRTGIATTTYYRQDHPFKSMAYKKEVRLADDTLISRMEDNWDVRHFADGSYFPYVNNSVEERYEIDGSLINRIVSSKTYDDFGNVLTNTIDYGDGDPDYTINEYENNEADWVIGRLTNAQRNNSARSSAPVRRSSFSYDRQSGLLISERIVTNDSRLSLTKTYRHDAYGNIVESVTSAPGIQSRVVHTEYDARGQFIIETTNALNHSEARIYDPGHGQQTSVTGPNSLTTIWDYDDFGRLRTEHRVDQTKTRKLRLRLEPDDPYAPANATYLIRVDSSGNAPAIQYMDMHDREVRRVGFGLDNQPIFTDTEYNALGDVARVSDPYFEGDTPVWTVNEYDELGRIVRSTAPGNRVSTTIYEGLTTTVINPLGQQKIQVLDARGRLVEVIDDHGSSIQYQYDSYGNLTQLTDPLGNITRMEYDETGNRTLLDDPDSGVSISEYNALGELVSTEDARGFRTTYQYDVLGRIVEQADQFSVRTWEYDTAVDGIGKIAEVTREPMPRPIVGDDVLFISGFEQSGIPPPVEEGTHIQRFEYDQKGRPVQTLTEIDGRSFIESQSYDDNGRVEEIVYPGGFRITQVYNEQGYLSAVQNSLTAVVYWRAAAVNARGQIELQEFGNGVTTQHRYDANTGYLDEIQSLASTVVQDLSFDFDPLGNLVQRRDEQSNLEENFRYDSLNRLTRTEVVGDSAKFIGYDELGNIVSRSDVGIYTYAENGAGPHALTSISGDLPNTYTYDASGNRISDDRGAVAYDPAGLPVKITRDSTELQFNYDASGARYKQIELNGGQVVRQKLYIGAGFEEEITSGGIKQIHYIRGGGSVIAIHSVLDSAQETTRYLHKDHLGSLETITDESGFVVERLSFDPWGKRRDATDWIGEGVVPETTDRGFTGHEQLDSVGLTHMNGRVYDPTVGRFLSPDPAVQAPDNTQSLNRYSYVLNNPLSYTDPSGFFFSKIFKAIKNFLSGNKIFLISAVIGIATGIWLSGILMSALNVSRVTLSVAVLSGAGAGFAGAASAAIAAAGGISDALRAGVKGAGFGGLSAGIFNQIGGSALLENSFAGAKELAHGAAGGVLEITQGGKFEHGFLSSFTTKLFSPALSVKFDDQPILSTSIAGVIGGTAAELGGGKFSNGAVTSTFAHLYNQLGGRRTLNKKCDGCVLVTDHDGNRMYVPPGAAPDTVTAVTLGHDSTETGIVNGSDISRQEFAGSLTIVSTATGAVAIMFPHPLLTGVSAVTGVAAFYLDPTTVGFISASGSHISLFTKGALSRSIGLGNTIFGTTNLYREHDRVINE